MLIYIAAPMMKLDEDEFYKWKDLSFNLMYYDYYACCFPEASQAIIDLLLSKLIVKEDDLFEL